METLRWFSSRGENCADIVRFLQEKNNILIETNFCKQTYEKLWELMNLLLVMTKRNMIVVNVRTVGKFSLISKIKYFECKELFI